MIFILNIEKTRNTIILSILGGLRQDFSENATVNNHYSGPGVTTTMRIHEEHIHSKIPDSYAHHLHIPPFAKESSHLVWLFQQSLHPPMKAR